MANNIYNFKGVDMQKLFQRLINYLLDQYAVVLVLLALVSVATYMVLITDIREQEGNALLVKMSTEQGQLVEEINLSLSHKTYLTDLNEIRKIDSKIVSNIIQLDESHASLREGVRFIREGQKLIHIPGQLSPDLRLLYYDGAKPLDSMMRDYLSLARKLQRIPIGQLTMATPDLNRLFFVYTPVLLDQISKSALLHQRQSEYMLNGTINKQHITFALTLASNSHYDSTLSDSRFWRGNNSIFWCTRPAFQHKVEQVFPILKTEVSRERLHVIKQSSTRRQFLAK